MQCSRCRSSDLVGEINGQRLCFDCYVATRPERPDFLPYPALDEQRQEWADAIAAGETPVVISVESEVVFGGSMHDLMRQLRDDDDET